MKFIPTPLHGAFEVELEPINDERGLFARTFCKNEFAAIGFCKSIVQINHSITLHRGSIRGMHYQVAPACEIKIIRCSEGSVFDVMVDLRAGSPTFLHWHGVELSKNAMRMVYIPEGFAHGFQTLSDSAELLYHHSEFYSPDHERGLRFDDPALAIEWPLPVGMVSDKDRNYPLVTNVFGGIKP